MAFAVSVVADCAGGGGSILFCGSCAAAGECFDRAIVGKRAGFEGECPYTAAFSYGAWAGILGKGSDFTAYGVITTTLSDSEIRAFSIVVKYTITILEIDSSQCAAIVIKHTAFKV